MCSSAFCHVTSRSTHVGPFYHICWLWGQGFLLYCAYQWITWPCHCCGSFSFPGNDTKSCSSLYIGTTNSWSAGDEKLGVQTLGGAFYIFAKLVDLVGTRSCTNREPDYLTALHHSTLHVTVSFAYDWFCSGKERFHPWHLINPYKSKFCRPNL